jgi:hypothetical protein
VPGIWLLGLWRYIMGKNGNNSAGPEEIRRTKSTEFKKNDLFITQDNKIDTKILPPVLEDKKKTNDDKKTKIKRSKSFSINRKIDLLKKSAENMPHVVPDKKASKGKSAKKLSKKELEKERIRLEREKSAEEIEIIHKDLEKEESKAFNEDEIGEINRKRFATLSESDIKKRVDAALKRKENAAKIAELEAETKLGEWKHVSHDKEQFAMHLRGYMMLTERPF